MLSSYLMADAPLYTSTRERRRQTDLADFYALLKASEAVEKAYARGAVSAADYEKACSQLVAQFRASEAALTGDGTIASTEAFFAQWRVDCPRARDRLLRVGAPATHLQKGDAVDAARVAECVQHFITAMDALRLDQRAVDEVQPLVADLAAALSRVAAPCPGGRAALEWWLVALNGMRAAEEIDDAQARQLAFDLDAAYAEFHRGLKDAS